MSPANQVITQEHQSLGWTIFIVFLSLLSVFAAIFLAFPALLPESVIRDDEQKQEIIKILGWADDILCAIFFCDFAVKLTKGGWHYFRTLGWLDLITSIPAFMVGWVVTGEGVVWHRFVRVLRVWRLYVIIKGIGSIRATLSEKPPVVWLLCFISLLTLTFVFSSAMLVLVLEANAQKEGLKGVSIDSAEKALWWAVVTATTVGYGDTVPVSSGGKIVAVFLMVFGIGLFGSLTAYIAAMLGGKREAEKETFTRIEGIESDIKQMRRLLEKLEVANTHSQSEVRNDR